MKASYSDNFDLLVSLICHLGSTDKASRTPTYIAKDLGFEKNKVVYVLDNFSAFFRRSKRISRRDTSGGDCFYTLHLRYSRRAIDSEEERESQPLATGEIEMLINLVTHMVAQEQENSRALSDLQQSYKNLESTNRITMAAAIIAAIGAIVAAAV